VSESSAIERASVPLGAVPVAGASRESEAPVIRVAALVVTWNRWEMANRVLAAIASQRVPGAAIDVVVIDNASSDGTTDRLCERWAPERIVDNPTQRALEPGFTPRRITRPVGPDRGFAPEMRGAISSLTIVRNAHNLGGCGGFNTGFMAVRELLTAQGRRPEFVWLVDDDVDLPCDALSSLLEPAVGDESIGLVGSRTCDIDRRDRTIETTIYLDPATGLLADEPGRSHRLSAEHASWAAGVGGPRGGTGYEGVREVDVVSACSLLARWEHAERVGFWDDRYFIYCDDADWSLRFGRAGLGVVLNLDAVVYHTPWHHKLTPARLYYAQRNLLWTLAKATPRAWGARMLARRIAGLLGESVRAAWYRRGAHAELIRGAVRDAVVGRGGKLARGLPEPEPIALALDRARALSPGVRIAAVCPQGEALRAMGRVRALARQATGARAGTSRDVLWTDLVRNDVPGAHEGGGGPGVTRIVYSKRLVSKLRRQVGLLVRPPRAVVVFDNVCDVPVVRGRWTLHVACSDPSSCRLERGGVLSLAAHAARVAWTGFVAGFWVAGVLLGLGRRGSQRGAMSP